MKSFNELTARRWEKRLHSINVEVTFLLLSAQRSRAAGMLSNLKRYQRDLAAARDKRTGCRVTLNDLRKAMA